jgi:hypothetical protein
VGNYLEVLDLGVDGRIILRWSLNKESGRAWAVVICLRTGRSAKNQFTEFMNAICFNLKRF